MMLKMGSKTLTFRGIIGVSLKIYLRDNGKILSLTNLLMICVKRQKGSYVKMAQKIKKPIFALILSAFVPGLGQGYLGFFRKAVIFFFLPLLFHSLVIFCFLSPAVRWNIFFQSAPLFIICLQLFIAMDAYREASAINKKENNLTEKTSLRQIVSIIAVLFLSFFISLPSFMVLGINTFIRKHVASPFRIPTNSMSPTIKEGDQILVMHSHRSESFKRGDIIAFTIPGDIKKLHIKRIVGLPGEKIEIRDGGIILNGAKIESKFQYFNIEGSPYGKIGETLAVPQNSYFVLGDKSNQSSDSRYYGFVPEANIKGKVRKIYMPFERSDSLD